MGLAASQARFLCITARRADCEYKSTELAQQKLDITKQLGAISTEYASAMNATKLLWQNDSVENTFGLSYSLLMMPSALNDYNPYMVTSPSGAIILNTEYAAAARAAGLSKAGGNGSQQSRDKFISALVPLGLVTDETAKAITKFDYKVDMDKFNKDNGNIEFTNLDTVTGAGANVLWDSAAGMGREPKKKNGVTAMTFTDLCLSESMGLQNIDWGKLIVKEGEITKNEYDKEVSRFDSLIASTNDQTVNRDVVDQLRRDLVNYENRQRPNIDNGDNPAPGTVTIDEFNDEIKRLKNLILIAENFGSVNEKGELVDENGEIIKGTDGLSVKASDAILDIRNQLKADKDVFVQNNQGTVAELKDKFNLKDNSIKEDSFSVVQNGVINHYESELEEMTLGDVLSGNIVLITQSTNLNGGTVDARTKDFVKQATKMLDMMAGVLGYSPNEDLTGKGLNIDEASAKALKFAYNMTLKTFLSPKDLSDVGSRNHSSAMTENSAYQNAIHSNRIGYVKGTNGKEYYAVSMSNMMSAFLTYYDNALAGANSQYVVGTTVDTSVYVTDNLGYQYLGRESEDTVTEAHARAADFYDELYNNILAHGWREDAAIDDDEYLEAALKDGRYSMSSLNKDGYYYQTRYNETGYMVEVSDTDAIERAEAEFASKKAELTYKEDSIDMKTKKLDAEISALTTEYDTVKGLISKSIDKTFAMFQN